MKVKKRLRQCRDYHKRCTREANSIPAEFKPTRIIYIPPDTNGTVYLTDTRGREVRSYAALSYCWGGEERNKLKTERATISDRQKGIECCRLPKTLQDAVTTARDLGFLYLWIDALCIIQDDDNDKVIEIERMSQVYRGASLTISASRAAHCDEGFLQRRNLKKQYLDVYQLPWREDSQQSHSHDVFCSEISYYYSETDPIDKRAWTMQEHRLARRLLRFGSGQLAFRCGQQNCIQVDGGPNIQASGSSFSTIPEQQLSYDWRKLIEGYTSRRISKWEDRLPAISAVADEFRRKLGYEPSDYLAGLWKPMLPLMLLWYIPTEGNDHTCASQPTTSDRYPTWSWQYAPKGIQHGMIFKPPTESGSLCVEECRVCLKSQVAPFGMVTEGYLVVEGFMEEVIWTGTSLMWKEPGYLDLIAVVTVKWDFEMQWLVDQPLYSLEVLELGIGYSQGLILEMVSGITFRRVGYYESHPTEAFAGTETARWLRHHAVQKIELI
ncbi:hypothetical protein PG984_013459 [Apiospora sp. TS-2023a]